MAAPAGGTALGAARRLALALPLIIRPPLLPRRRPPPPLLQPDELLRVARAVQPVRRPVRALTLVGTVDLQTAHGAREEPLPAHPPAHSTAAPPREARFVRLEASNDEALVRRQRDEATGVELQRQHLVAMATERCYAHACGSNFRSNRR